MTYLKLSDVMARFDAWGCTPAESLNLFRKFMLAVFEKRLTVEGYEGKPSDAGKEGRKPVPKDLFESSAILDWGRTPDNESYDILIDQDSIALHLGNSEFGDYFDRGGRPIWSGLQVEVEVAEPVLATLRTPALSPSLSLAEACCWISTRDPMRVAVTDEHCSSIERGRIGEVLEEIRSACLNGNLSVTGKLLGTPGRIESDAFRYNGFRLDGGGCVAPNGKDEKLLASVLVMEHSGRVVIGGDTWKGRPVWLDVRFTRDELMRLWPPHPAARTETEPDSEQRRLTDDDVKTFILAKERECGSRPRIRSWSAWPEMQRGGVTKPRFESLWREIYPSPKRGRPSKTTPAQ